MKIKNILNEVLSDIVYHKSRSPLSILKTDTFKLTSNAGTKSDRIGSDKLYYASFARSKQSAYLRSPGSEEVLFVLDGKKLNQNFKGGAVDYWQWHKKSDLGDMSSRDREQMLQSTEMEDRLFSDKPEIKNFSKYIIKVEIYVEARYENYISQGSIIMHRADGKSPEEIEKLRGDKTFDKTMDSTIVRIRNIVLECKRRNIPVEIFSEKGKFLFGGDPSNKYATNSKYQTKLDTKSNADDPSLKFPIKGKNPPEKGYQGRPWKRSREDGEVATILRVYYNQATPEDYSRVRYDFNPDGYYYDEKIRSLDADVHNNRSSGDNRDINRISKILTIEKLPNIDALIRKIIYPRAMKNTPNESLRIKIYRRVERLLEFLRDREDMPQVATDDLQPAVDMLKAAGVDITIVDRSPYGLKPYQKQMNGAAIKKLVDRYKDKPMSDIKPIVISNDGYIVDGHHRWGALLILNREHDNFPFIQIGLPRDQAIEAFNKVAEKFE